MSGNVIYLDRPVRDNAVRLREHEQMLAEIDAALRDYSEAERHDTLQAIALYRGIEAQIRTARTVIAGSHCLLPVGVISNLDLMASMAGTMGDATEAMLNPQPPKGDAA